jgi:hypothetical protein
VVIDGLADGKIDLACLTQVTILKDEKRKEGLQL